MFYVEKLFGTAGNQKEDAVTFLQKLVILPDPV